jgi:hypothetical protein
MTQMTDICLFINTYDHLIKLNLRSVVIEITLRIVHDKGVYRKIIEGLSDAR